MARVTLDALRERPPQIDRARMEATTEEDIRRHAMEDGEEPDGDCAVGILIVPPREVRLQLGMSQSEFARAIHVPLKTIQNWEQGRTLPDPAARALLAIIASAPVAALTALNPGRREEWLVLTERVAEDRARHDPRSIVEGKARESFPAE